MLSFQVFTLLCFIQLDSPTYAPFTAAERPMSAGFSTYQCKLLIEGCTAVIGRAMSSANVIGDSRFVMKFLVPAALIFHHFSAVCVVFCR